MYMLKQKYFLTENNSVITIEDIIAKKLCVLSVLNN